jgi:hypothetical protein
VTVTNFPPIIGSSDESRALRLALAVFDDDQDRYEAAIADAVSQTPELIYALVGNWIRALVQYHGCEPARIRVERELVGIAEHLEENRNNYGTDTDQ